MAESRLKNFLKYLKTNEVSLTIAAGFLVIVGLGLLLVSRNWWQNRRAQIDQQAAFTEVQASPSPQISESPLVQTELPPTPIESILPLSPTSDHYVTVEKGDSTWKLAEKYLNDGNQYIAIETANHLRHNQQLTIGQKLLIPAANQQIAPSQPTTTTNYVVKSHDSLWSIAQEQLGSGFRWVEIYRLNRKQIGRNPNLIYPQTKLVLPQSSTSLLQ